MLKFIREASAPSLFTKGLLRYKQGRFKESKRLILKAAKHSPDLKCDDFFRAVLLLVETSMGASADEGMFREALGSVMDSPYRNTKDHHIVVADLKNRISMHLSEANNSFDSE